MKNDNINNLFERLQGDFDIESPSRSHQENFLKKLKTIDTEKQIVSNKRNLWKPFIGIAASVLLMLTLVFNFNKEPEIKDLANVSQEMADTQSFFTSVITEELEKIKNNRTPETELLIKDALNQVDILEKEYQQLKLDLTESGNDKRVIHAMINNFMNRVDLLKSVLKNIEETKNLKEKNDENIITI
ncbi:hypothetical protein [uncultured Lacinutrix sp.]|uniref:hypothetical protein n=1 Tax=uncultured Lacinutrix sp. TaxID=574032 RepID=UPI002618C542|nr:hypothetical protein [uncultured Lacinutrix sp.]